MESFPAVTQKRPCTGNSPLLLDLPDYSLQVSICRRKSTNCFKQGGRACQIPNDNHVAKLALSSREIAQSDNNLGRT
jgi:hypothetical protein